MKYGDILRMSDTYIKAVPTCYKDKRIMFAYWRAGGYLVAVSVRFDPREERREKPGDLTNYSGKDVWVVADE